MRSQRIWSRLRLWHCLSTSLQAEFEQVCADNYDDGVRAFMYNVWREHPEWDLSFLGEAAREMIAEFNVPPETLFNDPPAEFVPPANQSP